MNDIIVIVGFSGVGKDSVANFLHKNYGYNFIQSVTSRPMRGYESEGDPYKFVTGVQFEQMDREDKFVEYRAYYTEFGVWYYGVLKSDVLDNEKYVVVLDYEGYSDFKKVYPDRVKSVWLYADDETRKERAIKRGSFDINEWNRRLADDKARFGDLDLVNKFDVIVKNYDFEEATTSIINQLGLI